MHIVPSLLFLLVTPSLAAARDAVLAELFARKNIEGTLVLSSLQSEQTFVHNDERSNRRFAVASTFKILHSLIALEEKVATGKDHVIRWNGKRHEFSDWNRDQTLEAFRVSCVWYYQELCPPDRSGEVPRLAEAFGLRGSCASRSKQRHSGSTVRWKSAHLSRRIS